MGRTPAEVAEIAEGDWEGDRMGRTPAEVAEVAEGNWEGDGNEYEYEYE
ncbi:MAG: hypothetical protein ACOX52_05780 [Verrucomicrobiota bacterium]